MVRVIVCLQQMETNASINLSPSWVLCSLYHDLHTKIILSFNKNAYSYPTLHHRITKDNFKGVFGLWGPLAFVLCTWGDQLRLHVSTRIIETTQINWSDTRADLFPWPCAHSNYPRPAVGSSERAVQGLLPVTLTNHAGPQSRLGCSL